MADEMESQGGEVKEEREDAPNPVEPEKSTEERVEEIVSKFVSKRE